MFFPIKNELFCDKNVSQFLEESVYVEHGLK